MRDGKVVEHGERPIEPGYYSSFHATPGVYELDIEMLSDANCLSPSLPRLTISTSNWDYPLDVALFQWPAGFCMALGASLTVLSIVGNRREKVIAAVRLNLSPSVGQNFQWAQRMALRRPFAGFPTFGIFGGALFGMLALLMMLITFGFRITARGLPVHLLQPGQVPQKSDAWTEPLIVLVRDAGLGQEPTLVLNGKSVNWSDFSGALKNELVMRKDWTVYVGGDDCVAYINIANVVDVARGYRAKVFLIDDPSRRDCFTPVFRPPAR